jgi:hypothetical protein
MRARAEQLTLERAHHTAQLWYKILGEYADHHMEELARGAALPLPRLPSQPPLGINERNLLLKSLRAVGFTLREDNTFVFDGLPTRVIQVAPVDSLRCWCGEKTSNDDHMGKPYCLQHQCVGTRASVLPHCGFMEHWKAPGGWFCEDCLPGVSGPDSEVDEPMDAPPPLITQAQAQGSIITVAPAIVKTVQRKRAREEDEDDSSVSETPLETPANKRPRTWPLPGQTCNFLIKTGVHCKEIAIDNCKAGGGGAAYCKDHQCKYTSEDGERCPRKAESKNTHCRVHRHKK